MSVDDILAANLWPWPDPLLKRDRLGNIIFVNAAFLSLYGGRIEDWCGRPLTGWPEPNLQGAQRFETRTGQSENEAIFDWVETVMADGNTMAIARNVTALIAQAHLNAQQAQPQQGQFTQDQNTHVQQTQRPPVQEQAPQVNVEPAPSQFEKTLTNDEDDYSFEAAPSTVQPPRQAAQPPISAPPLAADTSQKSTQAPDLGATQTQQPVTPEPNAQPAPLKIPEEPRMIERRALPIEDSESVLGNNWRDQVIAKAIGTDDVQPAPEPHHPVVPDKSAQANQAAPAASDDNRVGAGLHILLAEDNAINALLTRTLLEADGATVDTVEDGALAVEAVKSGTYDLIFMDMRMPKMDGLESTRKIRGLGKTMPIVALTANAFDDDRNACFDSGMNDFMTKPVSAEELTDMVSTWVKNVEENQVRLAG